jgi:hypothetical protein
MYVGTYKFHWFCSGFCLKDEARILTKNRGISKTLQNQDLSPTRESPTPDRFDKVMEDHLNLQPK